MPDETQETVQPVLQSGPPTAVQEYLHLIAEEDKRDLLTSIACSLVALMSPDSAPEREYYAHRAMISLERFMTQTPCPLVHPSMREIVAKVNAPTSGGEA